MGKNKAYTLNVNAIRMSDMFAGYVLTDDTLSWLVDEDYDTVVLIDPNRGRYVSDVEDWLDYGVPDGHGQTHLRQSRMERT